MSNRRTWPIACLLLIVLASCAVTVRSTHAVESVIPGAGPISPQTLDELHGPLLRRDIQILGAQSCAAASCHGGPRQGVALPTSRRGNEFQLWFENDLHANSWRTICSDESLQMMNRLKILDGKKIIDPVGFDNCLACHNTTLRHDEPRTMGQSVADFAREGVGCAACHGPSEIWSQTHFQANWSRELGHYEGFVNASDLYTRARMCASCHVGDKDRDMNHDIIAAGHPALRYELATFHAWQPKHWRDAEANDAEHYEPQLWLAGQVAAADAALSLIETRARQSHSVSEWPELAAFDCASCHHDLGFKNDRNPLAPNRNAIAPLARWNDSGLQWLIDYRYETGVANVEDALLREALEHVREAMQSQAKPDVSYAAESAIVARRALYHWFRGNPGNYERAALGSRRLGQVVASAAGKHETWKTWESAAQFYLAAVAARSGWPGGWSGPLYETAEALRRGLGYPIQRNVSRFETQASGTRDPRLPTANRSEAMQLGLGLAGWLGEVRLQPMDRDAGLTYDLQPQEIQQMNDKLREIAARWAKIKEEKKKSNEGKAEATEPLPEPVQPKPKRSLDDLRKSLEELQSGASDGN